MGVTKLSEIYKGSLTSENDLNEIEFGRYDYLGTSLPKNAPENISGMVVTVLLSQNSNVRAQYVSTSSGKIYLRLKYSSANDEWFEWKQIY